MTTKKIESPKWDEYVYFKRYTYDDLVKVLSELFDNKDVKRDRFIIVPYNLDEDLYHVLEKIDYI